MDYCTCRSGRDHDGSEFGPCEYCEEAAFIAGLDEAPVCKVDRTPLCKAALCQREGRCMGSVTYSYDFTEPKRWKSAEHAAYGRER
jgi:hypothetical protein